MLPRPLPEDLAAQIQAELAPGEHLLWTGQPDPRGFARRLVSIAVFGVFCTAFAIFWTWGATGGTSQSQGKAAGFFAFWMFGIPCILIGLGLLASPWWLRRKARRIAYAITDQRAFIVDHSRWRTRSLRTFLPTQLGSIRRVRHSGGTCDLIFDHTKTSEGENQSTDHGFLALPDATIVEAHLRQLTQKSTNTGTGTGPSPTTRQP